MNGPTGESHYIHVTWHIHKSPFEADCCPCQLCLPSHKCYMEYWLRAAYWYLGHICKNVGHKIYKPGGRIDWLATGPGPGQRWRAEGLPRRKFGVKWADWEHHVWHKSCDNVICYIWCSCHIVMSVGRHCDVEIGYQYGPLLYGWVIANVMYRKVSNIRRTKCQNLNDSRLVLQLSMPNPLKPSVKSIMKM